MCIGFGSRSRLTIYRKALSCNFDYVLSETVDTNGFVGDLPQQAVFFLKVWIVGPAYHDYHRCHAVFLLIQLQPNHC
jgi:hypothetical protein